MTVDDVTAALETRMRLTDANGLEILDLAECRDLLAAAHIGRVATASRGRPVVFPVNAVVEDDLVFVRCGTGTLFREAEAGHTVAFEVDGSDPTYQTGWSVLVSGSARVVTDPRELERVQHLPLRPWGTGAKDQVVAIVMETVSGRRIPDVREVTTED
ncbi:MAG: pyridoxamine 5'-phosphate oxidase family protein [Acidimicrobiia bacterium]|nr:pyridoxamine 5'-phosphate oxidase family protein [Acidimicrobiia bacterium]